MSEESKKDTIVSVDTLAKLFSMTAVRVQQLASDGIVEKSGRGKYKLWNSIRNYISYLQKRKLNQWDNGGGENIVDFQNERALLTQAKRKEAQLRSAVLEGRVLEAAAVEEIMTSMILAARSKLLAIPVKAAPQIAPENAAQAMEILTELVHEALAELASYDPLRIAERTDHQRLFREPGPGDLLSMGSAAEADSESVGGPAEDVTG